MPEKRLDMVGEGLLCGDATTRRPAFVCVDVGRIARRRPLQKPLGCGTYVLTRSQFR